MENRSEIYRSEHFKQSRDCCRRPTWLPVGVWSGWEKGSSGIYVAWNGWARGSHIHWDSLHGLMSILRTPQQWWSNYIETYNSVFLKKKHVKQYPLSSSDLSISSVFSAFKLKCKCAPFAPALYKCFEVMIQSTCSANSQHVLTGLKGALTAVAVAQRLHFLWFPGPVS